MTLPLWPFTPNWASPVTETLAWLTDVLQSRTGAEQRRALRLAPRRSFGASVMAHKHERTLFDLWVHTRAGDTLALPIWPDVQLLAAPVAMGASAVPCRTEGFDFVAGGMAALVGDDALDAELLAVDVVTPTGITLADVTQQAWPAGARLYPVRAARFAELPAVTRKTDELLTAELRFALMEPCDWPAQLPATLYRDAPVLGQRPNEVRDLTHGYERLTELLDNDTGVPAVTDTAGRGFCVQQHRFTVYGRAEQTALRALLYALRGRQRACWVPTHAADLQPVTVSGTTLTVRRCGYTDHAPLAPGRRDLRIELASGAPLHRRITGAVAVGANEQLALDGAALGVSAPAITRVSFMQLMRLASDDVEIEHTTDADGLASTMVTWRSLRDDLETTP